MLIFFAGTDGKGFAENARRGGGKNFLNSFYSLGCGKKAPISRDLCENYILDSGGYSARVHGIEIDVKKYAEYLNRYKIKFAFNLFKLRYKCFSLKRLTIRNKIPTFALVNAIAESP